MKKTLLFALVLMFQLSVFAQKPMSDYYGKTFKVNGGASIENFVTAIFDTKPGDWSGDVVFDRRNGYFSYSEEGDGSVTYNVSYWNRKDGKKLVIMSFQITDSDAKVSTESSTWGHMSAIQYGEDPSETFNTETGFRTYLYDEVKKQLVPTSTPPFNWFPNPTGNHFFLQLPREGKDIMVREMVGVWEGVYHTLKWNGMTFDFKREGNVPQSFFVTGNVVDIRNEPNGKVVFSDSNEKNYTLDILKIENGWCLIYLNEMFSNGDDADLVKLKGSPTGQYWIKASSLGANGRSESKLRVSPYEDSKVLMNVTEDMLVEPLEMRGKWVRVREVKSGTEGWMLNEELCSNPLTTCA